MSASSLHFPRPDLAAAQAILIARAAAAVHWSAELLLRSRELLDRVRAELAAGTAPRLGSPRCPRAIRSFVALSQSAPAPLPAAPPPPRPEACAPAPTPGARR